MRRLRTASPRRLLAIVAVPSSPSSLGARHRPGRARRRARSPLPSRSTRPIYDAARAPAGRRASPRASTSRTTCSPPARCPSGTASPAADRRRPGACGSPTTAACGSSCSPTTATRRSSPTARSSCVYDATSNTAYTGALPPGRQAAPADERAADARRRPGGPRQARRRCGRCPARTPSTTAGRRATPCGSRPKDDGGLLGAAELAWDAARGVPLRAAVYAQGQQDPVLELEATDISYGPIAGVDVDATPPAGREGRPSSTRRPASTRRASRRTCTGVDAVQKQLDFPLAAPDTLAGLPRKDVEPRDASATRTARSSPTARASARSSCSSARPSRREPRSAAAATGSRLPQVNIDGATGSELATALGTVADLRARRRRLHRRRLGPAGRRRERGAGPEVTRGDRGARPRQALRRTSPRSTTST